MDKPRYSSDHAGPALKIASSTNMHWIWNNRVRIGTSQLTHSAIECWSNASQTVAAAAAAACCCNYQYLTLPPTVLSLQDDLYSGRCRRQDQTESSPLSWFNTPSGLARLEPKRCQTQPHTGDCYSCPICLYDVIDASLRPHHSGLPNSPMLSKYMRADVLNSVREALHGRHGLWKSDISDLISIRRWRWVSKLMLGWWGWCHDHNKKQYSIGSLYVAASEYESTVKS